MPCTGVHDFVALIVVYEHDLCVSPFLGKSSGRVGTGVLLLFHKVPDILIKNLTA